MDEGGVKLTTDNMELSKKIEDVLKQHLPEMAAKELKEFIAGAEADKQQLAALISKLKDKEGQVQVLLSQEQDFKNAEMRHEKARLMELATNEKERKMEVEMLKAQLAAKDMVVNNSKEFLALIAKNPRAIEIMNHFNSEQQAGYTTPHGYTQPSAIQRTEIKTTEHKETKEDFNG